MTQLRLLIPVGINEGKLSSGFFIPYLKEAKIRLNGRPLTGEEFGSSAASAELLRKAMFEENKIGKTLLEL
jgi:hypothetical protein